MSQPDRRQLMAYVLVSVFAISGAFLISLRFVKRAKALGAEGMLPEDWREDDTVHEVRDRLAGTVERRDFTTEDVEIREASDGKLKFSGYASTSETPYQVGGFEETFAKGAFKRSLGENPDVVLLVNHTGLPLARTKSGTMTLSEDQRGLKVDAELDPSDPDVQAILPKMKRGDLTEMSFAFRATEDEWSERDTKRVVRSATIHKGDVSVVTRGANETTTSSLRSFLEVLEQRAGKKNSAADQAELKEIIAKATSLLEPEPDPETEVEAVLHDTLKIDVARAYVDVAKARRRA